MRVNIKQVPAGGEPFALETKLDLSGLRRWGVNPIPSPVLVQAVFRNRNGIITVSYIVRYTLDCFCARCLKPVRQEEELTLSHTLVERVEDERHDEFILVPDAVLDLQELVRTDVSLELQDVLLCSDGCKGLCPECGRDRNEEECGCAGDEPVGPETVKLGDLISDS